MYNVYLTRKGSYLEDVFYMQGAALEYAKRTDCECVVYCKNTLVATYSPITGFKFFSLPNQLTA